MIDLMNPLSLFRAKKSEAPVVSALVVNAKDDQLVEITEALKESGFSVEKVVKNEDGTVMFEQRDNPTEGGHAVKVSDHLIVILKGFDPSCYDGTNNGEFEDQLKSKGFMPGVSMAMDTLYGNLMQSLSQSTSSDQASSAVVAAPMIVSAT